MIPSFRMRYGIYDLGYRRRTIQNRDFADNWRSECARIGDRLEADARAQWYRMANRILENAFRTGIVRDWNRRRSSRCRA